MDRVIKLREYQAVPTIRRYIIVEPDAPVITVCFRSDGGGSFVVAALAGDEVLTLPEIDVEIPVATLYEAVELR